MWYLCAACHTPNIGSDNACDRHMRATHMPGACAAVDAARSQETRRARTRMGWYAKGGLRPHISHQLPFDQLPQALELLRDRKSTGKIVIRVQD